jgi:hypothetical protein
MSGRTAHLNNKVKNANVPDTLEPAVRDSDNGPPLSTMDNAVAGNYHVTSSLLNDNRVDLCVVGGIMLEDPVHPFIYPVGLEGEKGSVTKVNGLFNDRAMVNSICKDALALMKHTLGKLLHRRGHCAWQMVQLYPLMDVGQEVSP